MNFNIRKGIKEDMPLVYGLIQELALYENEPEAVKISVEDLEKDGFKENPEFEVFVAEFENKIIGMALFYKRYSTWEGRSLHLEDLIVNKEYRGQGIGKALYTEVMKVAYEHDIARVEWEVIDWNKSAIDFYLSTGATMIENWNLCQMTRGSLKSFLEKNEGI